MSEPPEISDPADGERLHAWLSYRALSSALGQAEAWNERLERDPRRSPMASGLEVGVGRRGDDGRYPLIWVRLYG
jgi:hypothetical protein